MPSKYNFSWKIQLLGVDVRGSEQSDSKAINSENDKYSDRGNKIMTTFQSGCHFKDVIKLMRKLILMDQPYSNESF